MFNKRWFLLVLTFAFYNPDDCDAQKLADSIKKYGTADNVEHLVGAMKTMLKPRVVGTQNHEDIKQFIVNQMQILGMTVEQDEFTENVRQFGDLKFTNIIGRLNPDADSYLTLACHYDSKYFANFEFIAAVDSAVPCAIMLNTLQTLQPDLARLKNRTDVSLMMIFFDGEEAFHEWTATDSLYGARHLAEKWRKQQYQSKSGAGQIRQVDRINVMVLLDLIGAPAPKFYNFFPNTAELHHQLYQIERGLSKQKMLTNHALMFSSKSTAHFIDDDHKPFLLNNVPIVHLIPVPFPKTWHTAGDNEDNLSPDAIINFSKIIRVFTYNYLNNWTPNTSYRI